MLLGMCAAVSACSGASGGFAPVSGRNMEMARLTPAQSCAIGYDMARQLYKVAQVSKTVIRVSPSLGTCGTWAAHYLRRAGFAVDETATRRDVYVFTVRTYEQDRTVIATAHLPGLRLTRAYRPTPFGVTPASGFAVTREGQDEETG